MMQEAGSMLSAAAPTQQAVALLFAGLMQDQVLLGTSQSAVYVMVWRNTSRLTAAIAVPPALSPGTV